MAILLDEQDPQAAELVHAQKAFTHTVNLLSAGDVHFPASVADVVVALREFHKQQLEHAKQAIENYVKKQRGEKAIEQSSKPEAATVGEQIG